MRVRQQCVGLSIALLVSACSAPPTDEAQRAQPSTTIPSQGTVVDASAPTTVDGAPGQDGAVPSRKSRSRSGSDGAVAGTTTTAGAGPPTSLGTGTTTTTTTTTNGPKCPSPRTCDRYAFMDGKPTGWKDFDGDGLIEIEFWIYDEAPADNSVTSEQIVAALLDGTRVWEEANPRIDFVYRGTTDSPPAQQDRIGGDRGPDQQKYRVTLALGAYVTHTRDGDGWIVETDIGWTPAFGNRAHNPCDWHRDGGCGRSGSGKGEIADLLVHEIGHILGLGDLSGAETEQLTMNPHGSWEDDRFHVTLGYGDKLGLSKLYPCGCPLTPIYEP